MSSRFLHTWCGLLSSCYLYQTQWYLGHYLAGINTATLSDTITPMPISQHDQLTCFKGLTDMFSALSLYRKSNKHLNISMGDTIHFILLISSTRWYAMCPVAAWFILRDNILWLVTIHHQWETRETPKYPWMPGSVYNTRWLIPRTRRINVTSAKRLRNKYHQSGES